MTDRRGAQAFGYDNLDRLTSATHPLTLNQSFSYDAVGNRLNNASLHNAGNQLTEDAGFTYQYDNNGNLTRKTVKTSGVHTDYTYDAENRLVKVEEFAAGATTPAATSTYRYDGLGRRIEKVGNGQTRRYVYDGEDILLEYDGTNTLQARYTHGPGIDEPVAMTRGTATYFFHQDGLGSVTDLTDSTASTVKTYSYDAWGNILQQTGTSENPYTYSGREFDAETELYYYRSRYYDPRTGRFLQPDSIGLDGGINLYSYVEGNPTTYIDPLGFKLTKAECAALRWQIINKGNMLLFELAKYDPKADAQGGFPMKWGSGRTKPGGHYNKINELQAGIKSDITRYIQECIKDNNDGNPPIPRYVDALCNRPVPEPALGNQPAISDLKYWEQITGLTGGALILYLIISEGSRVAVPARNLVPVP